MQARCGEALGDRPRGRRGRRRPGERRVRRAAELRGHVVRAPGGDLGEDPAPCGAGARPGPGRDRHARASVAARTARAPSDDRRSARSRWSSSDADPASRTPAACATPAARSAARPGGHERRTGVEQDDVAPGPALRPGEDRLHERRVLGRRAARELRGLRGTEPERRDVDLAAHDPIRRDVVDDAAPVERELVHARAMHDERSLRAQGAQDRRKLRGSDRVPHADELAPCSGGVRRADRAD